MVPRGAEEAQNGARSGPIRRQEEPKRDKKATPNHKTKKKLNQDDPKTVLDRPRGGLAQFDGGPGGPFGHPKKFKVIHKRF